MLTTDIICEKKNLNIDHEKLKKKKKSGNKPHNRENSIKQTLLFSHSFSSLLRSSWPNLGFVQEYVGFCNWYFNILFCLENHTSLVLEWNGVVNPLFLVYNLSFSYKCNVNFQIPFLFSVSGQLRALLCIGAVIHINGVSLQTLYDKFNFNFRTENLLWS